jgi:hypothetical protein
MFQGRHGIEQQLLQDAAYRVIINAGDGKVLVSAKIDMARPAASDGMRTFGSLWGVLQSGGIFGGRM